MRQVTERKMNFFGGVGGWVREIESRCHKRSLIQYLGDSAGQTLIIEEHTYTQQVSEG